jgi:hypothetical protein
VAGERRLKVAIQGAQPAAGVGGLGGELADEIGGDALARDRDRLLAGGGERLAGEFVGVPASDASGAQDVLGQSAAPRVPDFGRG